MRSKVIIFCALVICSKFVASSPFDKEPVRQRAPQLNNWQNGQNNAEYSHETGFARTHNVNPIPNSAQQYDNGQVFNVNQGNQQYGNYGYNNRVSSLQSLPTKDYTNFASSPERRSGYSSGGEPFPIGSIGQQARVDNQRFNKQNMAQNRYNPSNSYLSKQQGGGVIGSERPLVPSQETYHAAPAQHLHIVPSGDHQHYESDLPYTTTRDGHYNYPLSEKVDTVRYVDHTHTGVGSAPNAGSVRYENYNEEHGERVNTNVAKAANTQTVGIFNGSPAVLRDTFKGKGNYPAVPVNNRNIRYPENPLISGPVANTYNVPNGPVYRPVNNYRYEDNPLNSEPSVLDQFVNPRYREKSVTSSGFNNQVPVNTYDQSPVAPINNIPSNNQPASGYNGGPFNLINTPIYNNKPGPVYPNLSPGDGSSYQNSLSGSNRGNLNNLLNNPEIKNLLSSSNHRYVMIHPNGTVEHINELKQVTQNNPNYIFLKNLDKSLSGNNNGVTSSPIQPVASGPAPVYGQTNPSFPISPLNNITSPVNSNNQPSPLTQIPIGPVGNDTNLMPLQETPSNYSSPTGPVIPSNNNYPVYPVAGPSNLYTHINPSGQSAYAPVDGASKQTDNYPYSPSPVPGDDYKNSSLLILPSKLIPNVITPTQTPDDGQVLNYLNKFSNKTILSTFPQVQNANDTNSPSKPIISNDNSSLLVNNQTTPPLPLYAQISTTTTEAPTDILIESFLKSLSNEPADKPLPTQVVPSKNDNTAQQPLISNTNSSLSVVTGSPIQSTTIDQIVTLSPMETATDNVNYGTTSNPEVVTSAYGSQGLNKNTSTLLNITSLGSIQNTYNSTVTSSTPVLSQDDSNTGTYNNNTKSINDKNVYTAFNDSILINDVPATTNNGSAVIISSTKQSDVKTGDTATSGDDLLTLEPSQNEIKITLVIPNDADGTVGISVDVPDSTGNGDASDNSTLVIKIDTKNSTDAGSTTSTATGGDGQGTSKGDNNNFIIDLSNTTILWTKPKDKEFLDQLTSNSSNINIFYLFQLENPAQPLIETNKETTYYANNTVVEKIVKTTWKNPNDTSPLVVSYTKTYQLDTTN